MKTLTALSNANFCFRLVIIIARWLIAQFHLGRKFVQWTCKVQHNMQLLRGHGFQQTCIYFALKHRPKLTKQTPLVSARWPRPILDTVTAIFTLLVLFSSHQMSSFPPHIDKIDNQHKLVLMTLLESRLPEVQICLLSLVRSGSGQMVNLKQSRYLLWVLC